MGRPAKWSTPTVALRVPERFADALLAIAKQMDEGTYQDGSQGFVQNDSAADRASEVEDWTLESEEAGSLEIGDRVVEFERMPSERYGEVVGFKPCKGSQMPLVKWLCGAGEGSTTFASPVALRKIEFRFAIGDTVRDCCPYTPKNSWTKRNPLLVAEVGVSSLDNRPVRYMCKLVNCDGEPFGVAGYYLEEHLELVKKGVSLPSQSSVQNPVQPSSAPGEGDPGFDNAIDNSPSDIVDSPSRSITKRSEVVEVCDRLRLAVGDRVRLHCAGHDPRWQGKEAEILSFPFVKVRVEDSEFCWFSESLELLHSAGPPNSPDAGEFQPELDEDGLSPEDAALVNGLVDRAFAECEASGIPPEKLLLHLKGKELIDFLSNFRTQDQKEFVVRLLDGVMHRDGAVYA